MTMERIKAKVHIITNHLQGIIGYLELEQYDKAIKTVREAISEFKVLGKMIAGYMAEIPVDSVVVVPPGTTVVSPSDVTDKVPKGVLTIVPKDHLKK